MLKEEVEKNYHLQIHHIILTQNNKEYVFWIFLEIFCKLEDCSQTKLTIGMFFEFIKLAYQVNDNCESLTAILTTGNKLDWSKLAKINLHCDIQNYNSTNEKYVDSNVMQRHKNSNVAEETLSDTDDNGIKCSLHYMIPSDVQFKNKQICSNDKNLMPNFESCNQIVQSPLQVEDANFVKSVDATENFLISLMKTNLSDVLHEGLLDSILPYMIPKPVISQPIIKKSITNTEVKKCSSLSNNIETRAITNISHKEKEKDKNKSSKRSAE